MKGVGSHSFLILSVIHVVGASLPFRTAARKLPRQEKTPDRWVSLSGEASSEFYSKNSAYSLLRRPSTAPSGAVPLLKDRRFSGSLVSSRGRSGFCLWLRFGGVRLDVGRR
jgi:hypothetical protein